MPHERVLAFQTNSAYPALMTSNSELIDLPIDETAKKLLDGDRAVLARTITLIESAKPEHQARAQELLQYLLPHTASSRRIGITGVPGAGKSTLIEALGTMLTAEGHKLAVLAVDPTSSRSGGSILADKTRMQMLAANPDAFIRPSPTSGTLGGVTKRTRETMALCEAAGFDIIIVETVGVGQSETAVSEMVDFFLALMVPGAGDEIQGLKKGVLEIADMIVVNKMDGEMVNQARRAAGEYRAALHILTPADPNWQPPVITISARENLGLDKMWEKIETHRRILMDTGAFETRRKDQAVKWMHDMIEDRLISALRDNQKISSQLPELEQSVRAGEMTPAAAAKKITALFGLS